jgi:hypothetical protein
MQCAVWAWAVAVTPANRRIEKKRRKGVMVRHFAQDFGLRIPGHIHKLAQAPNWSSPKPDTMKRATLGGLIVV